MNLTLTYEAIWTGAGSGLLIALEKFDSCDQSSNSGLIDVKMDGFVIDKKTSFKMLV